jgi:hypothetical protein
MNMTVYGMKRQLFTQVGLLDGEKIIGLAVCDVFVSMR